jgi:hypothetical protein
MRKKSSINTCIKVAGDRMSIGYDKTDSHELFMESYIQRIVLINNRVKFFYDHIISVTGLKHGFKDHRDSELVI